MAIKYRTIKKTVWNNVGYAEIGIEYDESTLEIKKVVLKTDADIPISIGDKKDYDINLDSLKGQENDVATVGYYIEETEFGTTYPKICVGEK